MNTKRNFGTFLTIFGMIILIFTAALLINSSETTNNLKTGFIYGFPGLLFFFSGMGISKSIKEEA